MPIKIQNDLPVKEILERENIFVMDENRSFHQDIRPLKILILNLMPLKEETEAHSFDPSPIRRCRWILHLCMWRATSQKILP